VRDLERRLRAVEVAGSGAIEIWIHQGDGTVRGPRGEQMTGEEAEALGRATRTVTARCHLRRDTRDALTRARAGKTTAIA
jgi:hypothetical protein